MQISNKLIYFLDNFIIDFIVDILAIILMYFDIMTFLFCIIIINTDLFVFNKRIKKILLIFVSLFLFLIILNILFVLYVEEKTEEKKEENINNFNFCKFIQNIKYFEKKSYITNFEKEDCYKKDFKSIIEKKQKSILQSSENNIFYNFFNYLIFIDPINYIFIFKDELISKYDNHKYYKIFNNIIFIRSLFIYLLCILLEYFLYNKNVKSLFDKKINNITLKNIINNYLYIFLLLNKLEKYLCISNFILSLDIIYFFINIFKNSKKVFFFRIRNFVYNPFIHLFRIFFNIIFIIYMFSDIIIPFLIIFILSKSSFIIYILNHDVIFDIIKYSVIILISFIFVSDMYNKQIK